MLKILYVLDIIAMISVLFTLFMGARALTNRSDPNRGEISNTWMRRRILTQAIAFVLIIATVMVKRNSG